MTTTAPQNEKGNSSWQSHWLAGHQQTSDRSRKGTGLSEAPDPRARLLSDVATISELILETLQMVTDRSVPVVTGASPTSQFRTQVGNI